MTLLYLLDTNIISDLIRHPTGKVTQRIEQVGENSVCTSIVVACELRFGAMKKGSTRLNSHLSQILAAMEVLPLNSPAELQYAQLRTHLERSGTPIGPNDMLIAAHALTYGLTLVTANTHEFSRVPGLMLENWLS